jgi:hypothetical protein
MKHFLVGTGLGIIAATIAYLFGLDPLWAMLIGIGVAAVVWLRLYRLDKLLDAGFDILD